MNKQEVRSRIEEIGVIPSIRVSNTEDALFAAEAVARGGIPILELIVAAPATMNVISQVVQKNPQVIVGAGSVHDVDTARRCLEAGAMFLSSHGLDPEMVKFAVQEDVVVIPGTLTPTGVIGAWKLAPDFVKVVPCGHIGGDEYIRDLKAMFPEVPLIAAGGVNQRTAFDFIRAGAVALGIGGELIPSDAVRRREPGQVIELAGRFLRAVGSAREQFGGR